MLKIETEMMDWRAFCERFTFLRDELAPAFRSIDEDTISHRTENWSILPDWDAGEMTFEYYGDGGEDEIQCRVTGVPWGSADMLRP